VPQYELNLRDYLRIFRKRRLIIILTSLAVLVSSVFYVSSQPIVFEASATVKIEERKTIAGLLTEWIVYSPGDVMESETKFIKSYSIMKKVALRLGLIDEDASLEKVNEVVGGLQAKVKTERIKDTNMIRISVVSGDPKEAVEVTNNVTQAYVEENLAEKAKQARHARLFIEEQLASLEERLKNTEEQLKQFGDEVGNIKLADPIEQQLVKLQFELSELMQKYTEKHPRIMQLKEQIREMESQVKGFSGQELEYARMAREVEVNKKLYAMLKEKLEEARITEAQKIGDVSIVDPAVMPRGPISGNKGMGILMGALLGIVLGFTLAFISETLDTSIGTIDDVESVVKLPVLGVIPSIMEEMKKKDGLLAGFRNRFFPVPKGEEEEKFVRLVAHYKPRSPVTEAYRNIHTNLKLDTDKKAILVTSSGPREGKSTVVSNLGIVMAQTGLRTLLVSADLRRPVLSKTFGVKKEPGLHELIMGTAKLEEVLYNITDIMLGDMKFEDIRLTPGIENIWIMPSGRLPSNPVEVLDSKEIPSLIAQLKSRFDVVIFDVPPVLPVTDASLLAPKVDCVVIVYEIGRTSREALMRTKTQLESVGARISGVILNNTRPQTENLSSYPYYYHYKYTYTDKDHNSQKSDKET
jgi:capsular exopolysaccharide synthesis family protein